MKIQGEVLWLTPEERDQLDIVGRYIVIRKEDGILETLSRKGASRFSHEIVKFEGSEAILTTIRIFKIPNIKIEQKSMLNELIEKIEFFTGKTFKRMGVSMEDRFALSLSECSYIEVRRENEVLYVEICQIPEDGPHFHVSVNYIRNREMLFSAMSFVVLTLDNFKITI